jgi:hypothetical protein
VRETIAFGRVSRILFRAPSRVLDTTIYRNSFDSTLLDLLTSKNAVKTFRLLSFNMSKASNARSKFAELRALRESGKKRLDSYQVHQEEDLYEEVDEDGYKKVVRERLNQDDFVIDDNGEGYADDGREEWDRRPGYDTESEEDLPVKGKSGKAGKLGTYWSPNSL